MTHFLQSHAWEAFQHELGRKTFRDQGDGWSYLAVLEHGTGNTRLYVPYGPTYETPAQFDAAMASLTTLAREQSATFIRVEPMGPLTPSDLKARKLLPVTYQHLQPHATQIIDLQLSRENLLAQMSQNTRNITRNYTKKDIRITTSRDPKDISILTTLLQAVAARTHLRPHSDEYFQAQARALMPLGAATLYVARLNDTPIAASLVFDSDSTRYYAHAAADDAYRKLSAGTALLGQMILDAKEQGLRYVDLYGIADTDDPTHPWAGFTKFKKSFGGSPSHSAGAWDLPIRRFAYWAYRAYHTLRSRLRK